MTTTAPPIPPSPAPDPSADLLPADVLGEGPPLLLLHGLGSGRRDWTTLAPLLAEHFTTIAVDLPGQGDAAPLPRRPTVSALADALEADLDARGLAQVHVLGNSLGGRLALELARRGRALSVVAVGPSGTSLPPERVVQGSVFLLAAGLVRVLRPALPAMTRSSLGRSALLPGLRLLPWRATAREASALGGGLGSPDIWRLLVWSTLLDVAPPMRRIACPVTLAQGSHDVIATGQTVRFRPMVRGSRLQLLPFAGHAPMTDVPARLVRLTCETAGLAS